MREDALTLFGFLSQREKDLFLKLISISGIGPKLAIAILSGAQVEELAKAIADGNLARLTAIPGVGRKTAERLVLELKGQMTPFLLPEQVEAIQRGRQPARRSKKTFCPPSPILAILALRRKKRSPWYFVRRNANARLKMFCAILCGD